MGKSLEQYLHHFYTFSFCQYQVLKRLGCLVTVMSFSKNWSKVEFFVLCYCM